ncbi:MAG TPA: hypothetical protein DCE42_04710 [Myxococcales bacterium]|nr:hypothetical protein [Myxococcales bacterium]
MFGSHLTDVSPPLSTTSAPIKQPLPPPLTQSHPRPDRTFLALFFHHSRAYAPFSQPKRNKHMINQQSLQQWLAQRNKQPAIVCDIDETLCTQFDHPIVPAIRLLRQLAPPIILLYLTARPEGTKDATVSFLEAQHMPFVQHLYLCPHWQSTTQHKCAKMRSFAKEYNVLLSIGDAEEDQLASEAANIPFARISLEDPAGSWHQLTPRLQEIAKTYLPNTPLRATE